VSGDREELRSHLTSGSGDRAGGDDRAAAPERPEAEDGSSAASGAKLVWCPWPWEWNGVRTTTEPSLSTVTFAVSNAAAANPAACANAVENAAGST
jgi:hypothetical protein